MPKRSRARWLALVWMLFALLSWPVAGWCQDEEQPETEEETAARHEREDEAEKEEAVAAWEQTWRGLYLQAQGNVGVLTSENDAEDEVQDASGLTPPVHTTSDAAWGAGGRLGWRVMKHLAIEGQAEIMGDFEFDHDLPSGEEKSHVRFLTATVNAKGYLPFGRFQPYGVLGGGYANAKVNPAHGNSDYRHGGALRVGAGLDLYGNENVGVFTEAAYVRPFGDLEDFDHVAIGFGFFLRFYGN